MPSPPSPLEKAAEVLNADPYSPSKTVVREVAILDLATHCARRYTLPLRHLGDRKELDVGIVLDANHEGSLWSYRTRGGSLAAHVREPRCGPKAARAVRVRHAG
jgi:hypothetical protein